MRLQLESWRHNGMPEKIVIVDHIAMSKDDAVY